MPKLKADSAQTQALLDQLAAGDARALDELLDRHRPELLTFVTHRLDPKVRGRFSASDVVQEAQLEVVRRMNDYQKRRPMPFHLWIRKMAYQRLMNMQRDHRERAKRTVDREVGLPAATSALLARSLRGKGPSPSAAARAREAEERLAEAIAKMSEVDREVLLMRHVEELPYEEIACLLDVEPAAARQRYGRAMIRLQRVLSDFGLLE